MSTTTRERWAGLVRGWRRSGQTAREFAGRAGVNAGTLAYWAWRLRHEGGRDGRVRRRVGGAGGRGREGGFVELIVDGRAETGFVLELGDGRRLRIAAGFDAGALQRLLGVLGEARR